ncbi:MAG TPA: hypothetical protein VHB48_00240 [Chitinophagaceae bacterium]|nr:hypothetical protein [Chitinophagaceae bacterium]
MHEEKELTGEESLKLISRMINEARGYFYESGLGALVYGFAAVICCILSYFSETGKINFPFHPFYLMAPVFVLQGFIQYREEKKKKAKTFTDEAIDYVWTGFFIAILAAMCAGFAGIHYVQISFVIILAGLASFLTGTLSKMRYLVVCSFVCWAAGIFSFFLQNPNIYLVLAFVAALIWIVPGFILNAYFKKQQHGR